MYIIGKGNPSAIWTWFSAMADNWGGGGGGGLALDFKDFWDGVYNFFFLLPLGIIINTKDDTFTFMCTGS